MSPLRALFVLGVPSDPDCRGFNIELDQDAFTDTKSVTIMTKTVESGESVRRQRRKVVENRKEDSEGSTTTACPHR